MPPLNGFAGNLPTGRQMLRLPSAGTVSKSNTDCTQTNTFVHTVKNNSLITYELAFGTVTVFGIETSSHASSTS